MALRDHSDTIKLAPASKALSDELGRPVRLIRYADALALAQARARWERMMELLARAGFRFDVE
jgi:hypothetical protein